MESSSPVAHRHPTTPKESACAPLARRARDSRLPAPTLRGPCPLSTATITYTVTSQMPPSSDRPIRPKAQILKIWLRSPRPVRMPRSGRPSLDSLRQPASTAAKSHRVSPIASRRAAQTLAASGESRNLLVSMADGRAGQVLLVTKLPRTGGAREIPDSYYHVQHKANRSDATESSRGGRRSVLFHSAPGGSLGSPPRPSTDC